MEDSKPVFNIFDFKEETERIYKYKKKEECINSELIISYKQFNNKKLSEYPYSMLKKIIKEKKEDEENIIKIEEYLKDANTKIYISRAM